LQFSPRLCVLRVVRYTAHTVSASLVNRVPGNFHIEMRSKYHSVHPPVANLSHVVNSLTFGPPIERKVRVHCV
jgi:hypothetical protein